jgi:hypothetical protein
MSPPTGSHHRFPLYQQMIAAMLFGAIIGITLNATLGSNRVTLTEGLPKGWSEVTIDEDTNRATMSIRRADPASAAQGLSEQTLIVEANRSGDGVYPSWEALQVAHPEAADLGHDRELLQADRKPLPADVANGFRATDHHVADHRGDGAVGA